MSHCEQHRDLLLYTPMDTLPRFPFSCNPCIHIVVICHPFTNEKVDSEGFIDHQGHGTICDSRFNSLLAP